MGQTQNKTSSNQLKLGLTKDRKYLVALLPTEYSADASINREWLQKQIERRDFADLFPIEETIEKLIKLYNAHSIISKLLPIAERRNATVSIEISDDHMSAFLNISPAYGGTTIDAYDIKQLLIDNHISHGIDKDAIADAISRGRAEYKLIAAGTPVEHGEDAKFVSLLPEAKDRTPRISEDGLVDFRELGEILVVEEGTELMRRIPATAGTPGNDIFGNVVDPIPGEEYFFSGQLEGACSSPQNANLLVATTKGQPILVENGVNVEKIITYPNVNLATGNVHFDGSVIVEGDVAPGMTINVTGDIVIHGVVEASNLKADGDIKIAQSIIGHGDVYDQSGNRKEDISVIEAKGSIFVKYLENVRLIAGDSITIQEQALRCDLEARNEIHVGGKKSQTGHLIGGIARSGILIRANVFGSPAGAKTLLEVGVDENIHKKIEMLNGRIAEVQGEISQKNSLLNSPTNDLATFNPERYKQTKIDLRKLERRMDAYVKEKETYKIEVKRIMKGQIIIDKGIHANCTVRIARQQKALNENLKARTYRIRDNRLIST